jgi:metal-responsive CopG/Arc/MetJ family transcriptional regulator
MKTVHLTLDERLVDAVDRASKKLGTTRSAFARRALRETLEKARVLSLEEKHRTGYQRHPVGRDEFKSWDREQTRSRRSHHSADSIADLVGSVDGLPADLSVRRKNSLKASGYGRKRTR